MSDYMRGVEDTIEVVLALLNRYDKAQVEKELKSMLGRILDAKKVRLVEKLEEITMRCK